MADFRFDMSEVSNYDNNSLLINTVSTFLIIKNPKMVVTVRKSSTTMNAKLNSRQQTSTYKADLSRFFEVWFNIKSVLNILSWVGVRYFRITVDTDMEACIHVHISKDKVMKFT